MSRSSLHRPLSLRAQALALLSRREHSRLELRRKLLEHGRKRQAAGWPVDTAPAEDAEQAAADPHDRATELDELALAAAVDAVLDGLQAQHHLSDSRFAESRIHSRASRHGHARIRQELAQHGLELDDEADRQLRDTELERAREVWRRRFGGQVASSPSERAKQLRFLAGRGFAADVAYRIVGGRDEDG